MSDWVWVSAMVLMGVLGLVIGITLRPVDEWPSGAQAFWRGFSRGFTFGAVRQPAWINRPCPYGCDCGECYSRSPDDQGSHHCDLT